MAQKLRFTEIAGISFFIYSLFFGAGNLIFPIKVGYRVGSVLTPTMIGFLLAAVAIPAAMIWACTRVDGGVDKIMQPLPRWMGVSLAIALYLIIGPFLGLPRFSGVAYTTIKPLLPENISSSVMQLIFSLVFFITTLVLAINPARILHVVGKVMAPALVIVLLAIAVGAVLSPQGPVASPDVNIGATKSLDYFIYGLKEGYQTLNALGSLLLGIVIINAVHGLGLDRKTAGRYTMLGMLFGGIGLAITNVALAYLGATAHDVVGLPPSTVTGAEIGPPYAEALYGQWGIIALAIVIILASLTTAIGIITACGEYFSKLFPKFGYRSWVTAFTLLSIFVANVGLGPLLLAAKPVLLGIYPIALCITALSLLKNRMPNQPFVFMFTLAPVIPLGLIEGARTAGISAIEPVTRLIDWLPLFEAGFAWILPAMLFFGLGMKLCPTTVETDYSYEKGS